MVVHLCVVALLVPLKSTTRISEAAADVHVARMVARNIILAVWWI